MAYKKLIIISLISILFLSGCAYFRKPPPADFSYISWKKRQIEHMRIAGWKMSGVLSITHKRKRDIARFAWKQRHNDYSIKLSGPMNMGSVLVEGDEDKVKLWRTSDEFVEAYTPEDLMYRELGWRLPVSYIRYWILGIPAPDKVDYKYFDRYGHLNFFKQKGWQVKYSDFVCGVKRSVDLPRTIELQNKDIAIKIKIKELDVD